MFGRRVDRGYMAPVVTTIEMSEEQAWNMIQNIPPMPFSKLSIAVGAGDYPNIVKRLLQEGEDPHWKYQDTPTPMYTVMKYPLCTDTQVEIYYIFNKIKSLANDIHKSDNAVDKHDLIERAKAEGLEKAVVHELVHTHKYDRETAKELMANNNIYEDVTADDVPVTHVPHNGEEDSVPPMGDDNYPNTEI